MRKRFQMTQEDLDALLEASKPVPYMVVGGVAPSSPQENANAAWRRLGEKMGFDHMTVQPEGSDQRLFTAETNAKKLKTRYFSFGQIHVHSLNGQTFDKDCIVEITAEEPREVMFQCFGDKWAFEYNDLNDDQLRHFPRGVIKLSTP